VAYAVVSYRLDLIIRLIDTTTGFPVYEQQVIFREKDHVIAFLGRGEGLYVLLNHGRENRKLGIEVRGYEPVTIDVDYEKLSPKFPEIEVPLIPIPREQGLIDIYTLTGKKRGLTAISAVWLDNPIATIGKYVENKRILKLFNAKSLDEKSYAVLNTESMQYEEISVAKKTDKLSLKLLQPIEEGWKVEEPLMRVVRGRVGKDGTYLIRIRDQGGSNKYLVCFDQKGKKSYEEIDFGMIGKEEE
jgi:hypothetical protein